MKISIKRRGSFAVGWHHSHDHQCGNIGLNVLSFDVAIDALDTDLNPQGYILDNLDIPKYFDTKYRDTADFVSCEKIAQHAVRDLRAICQAGGSNPLHIYVGIIGITDSVISAESEF